MKCVNCGRELNETDKFCIGCGTKVEQATPPNQTISANSINQSVSNRTASSINESVSNRTVNSINESVSNRITNSGVGISTGRINFMVRRYFFGFGDLLVISLIAWIVCSVYYGMMLTSYSLYELAKILWFIRKAAGVVFIGSIILSIYTRVIGMGKINVDKARKKAIIRLTKRAQEKFNVNSNQIKEVEPLIVAGPGITPAPFVIGVSARITRVVGLFYKVHTKDPMEEYRTSYNNITRYLLLQTTCYAFTEDQILIYSGNIDISTGMIYHETVSEIFYQDINSIEKVDVLRKCNTGIFGKKYYVLHHLILDVCGVSKNFSFDSGLINDVDKSIEGMKSYIRDKKIFKD